MKTILGTAPDKYYRKLVSAAIIKCLLQHNLIFRMCEFKKRWKWAAAARHEKICTYFICSYPRLF